MPRKKSSSNREENEVDDPRFSEAHFSKVDIDVMPNLSFLFI